MCQDKRRPPALAEREARARSACGPRLQPHGGRQPKTIGPRREDSSCLPDGDRMTAAGVIEGRQALEAKTHLPPYDPHVTDEPVTLLRSRHYGHEVKGFGQA